MIAILWVAVINIITVLRSENVINMIIIRSRSPPGVRHYWQIDRINELERFTEPMHIHFTLHLNRLLK
jgi:hypothetical protein